MRKYDEKTMPVIVLTGCTGSGKSEIGIQLAKEINGFIINADSKQVYKEIPIATAQPTPQKTHVDHWIIDGVEHYLYGQRSIRDQYTIQEFQSDVYQILRNKKYRGQIPILLGGSGLYIQSITHNFQLQKENKPDEEKREGLKSLSIEQLQELAGEKLRILNQSDSMNPVRLIRLIEKESGVDLGEQREYLYFAVELAKDELQERNHSRISKMIEAGLEEEARKFEQELINNDPKFDIIGLQEFRDYFLGEMSLQEVIEMISLHTNQYAKRQRTWFKREKNCIYVHSFEGILPYLKNFPLQNTL